VLQAGYAGVVVLRPTRPLLQAGLIANAGVVALWVYTRTLGIPFGPGGGEVEALGAADLLASGFEVMAIVVAVVALRRHSTQSHPRPGISPAQQLAAVLAVVGTSAFVATVGVG
jgi:hypothetical protein